VAKAARVPRSRHGERRPDAEHATLPGGAKGRLVELDLDRPEALPPPEVVGAVHVVI
jgi:hypothetical protein